MKTLRDAIGIGSIVGVTTLVGTIGMTVAGSMWADDLTDSENLYCEMVAEGTWQDYKKIFEKSCKDWLTEQKKAVN